MTFGRLAIDGKLLRASADRIAAAEAACERQVSRKETLMVVGRGTNDRTPTPTSPKWRACCGGMGFGWTEVCYSGVAYPLVDEACGTLSGSVTGGSSSSRQFLFTGILVDRIYAHADACREAHPEIEIVKADYLNDHPLVIDTFIERLDEAMNGANLMNCLLCKYREQVLGYEADRGAPQIGHHYASAASAAEAITGTSTATTIITITLRR